jgi:hypothetical protein
LPTTTEALPTIPTEQIELTTSPLLNVVSSTQVDGHESGESLIRISATSAPSTSLNTNSEATTIVTNEKVAVTEDPSIKFVQKNATSVAVSQDNDEDTDGGLMLKNGSNLNQVQNLRSMNLLKTNASETLVTHEASSSSYNLARSSSPKLSVALYTVIALLCFSLFVNIVLLYISKRKHMNREKLIIRHEICDTKSENTQSQRSGLNSHGELHDCNINLINSSSDSAASALDIEQ